MDWRWNESIRAMTAFWHDGSERYWFRMIIIDPRRNA